MSSASDGSWTMWLVGIASREQIDRGEIHPWRTQAFRCQLEKENSAKDTRQSGQLSHRETDHCAITEAWRKKYFKKEEVVNSTESAERSSNTETESAHRMQQHRGHGWPWGEMFQALVMQNELGWHPQLWHSKAETCLACPIPELVSPLEKLCDTLGKK